MTNTTRVAAPIHGDMTASEMIEALFLSNFDYMLQWQEKARNWDEIRGVHQLRVSLRRMRSLFTIFRKTIPRELANPWTDSMRSLAGQAGMARDLDVLLSETIPAIQLRQPHAGAPLLLQQAENKRQQAYKDVNSMLDSTEYAEFCRQFPTWVRQRPWEQQTKTKVQKRLQGRADHYANTVLEKRTSKIIKAGNAIDRSDAEAMHELRIEFKKLRYAAESFLPLFPDLSDFLQHGKGMQKLLGALNDVEVMDHLLEMLIQDDGNTALHHYAGTVSGWHRHRANHLLQEFDVRWQDFSTAEHCWISAD